MSLGRLRLVIDSGEAKLCDVKRNTQTIGGLVDQLISEKRLLNDCVNIFHNSLAVGFDTALADWFKLGCIETVYFVSSTKSKWRFGFCYFIRVGTVYLEIPEKLKIPYDVRRTIGTVEKLINSLADARAIGHKCYDVLLGGNVLPGDYTFDSWFISNDRPTLTLKLFGTLIINYMSLCLIFAMKMLSTLS
jgi:hypothetical protein